MTRVIACLAVFLHWSAAVAQPVSVGDWDAWLESPGGELRFGLELAETPTGGLRAIIRNAGERIELDAVTVDEASIRIDFPHYDSTLTGRLFAGGRVIRGRWRKVGRDGTMSELPFHAARSVHGRRPHATDADMAPATGDREAIDGRWLVDFESSDEPAIGVFRVAPDGHATGTFLTTTGDYRFLEGEVDGGALTLACFDGAHAFLFRATLREDGSLAGDFWSRDAWHESWTAEKDPGASLPDGFGETAWVGDHDLSGLVFRNLDGEPTSVASLHEEGQPMILEVFGSWCPNCHDAAVVLEGLHERYADRGLRIVGLAFEHTGDFDRDARQVRRFAERHESGYPLLVAGVSDKAVASRALPVLDRIRAYPTTIFIDGEGKVRAIHTGFAGPATGEAHDRLRESFDPVVGQLLGN